MTERRGATTRRTPSSCAAQERENGLRFRPAAPPDNRRATRKRLVGLPEIGGQRQDAKVGWRAYRRGVDAGVERLRISAFTVKIQRTGSNGSGSLMAGTCRFWVVSCTDGNGGSCGGVAIGVMAAHSMFLFGCKSRRTYVTAAPEAGSLRGGRFRGEARRDPPPVAVRVLRI